MENVNCIVNIIMCYNNKKEICKYIELLNKMKECEKIFVCIVINDQTNPLYFEDIKNSRSCKITVVTPKRNLGYLNGAIYGYTKIRDTVKTKKWVIVSNTDIIYRDENFFRDLCEKQYLEDIWAIGPDIYCPATKEHQNPRYIERISKKRMWFYIVIYSNFILAYLYMVTSQLKKKFLKHKNRSLDLMEVYLIHGAYIVASEELMEELVKNPFKGFIFNEEQHIAEIARRNKKKIYFDPTLKLIHNEHTTTGKMNFLSKYKQMKKSYIENYKLFYRN